MSARGFFEVGIYHGKTEANVGTLWRSALQLGAAGVFTIGARYKKQASDTYRTWRHIPYRAFADFDQFHAAIPHDCPVIAVEMGGETLGTYKHPQRAVYLLGAEDHGLPPRIVERCHGIISLQSVGQLSYNVAVAGSLVMYDRCTKNGAFS